MAGFDRYEGILKLFLDGHSSWTVPAIADELATAQSSIYRSVRELVAAGFLEGTSESRYRLGPVFLEFDHALRASDLLVRSGGLFLRTLVEQAGLPCAAVLARLYGNRVMCVADARSARFDAETSYVRGRPMPILRGATSKAILASMTGRKRARLLSHLIDEHDPKREALNQELDQIRKVKMCVTRGEVDSGLVGMAVPVRNLGQGINASLSFIMKDSDASEAREPRLISLLASHAALVESFMNDAEVAAQQDVAEPDNTL